jgi:hypothetical protein
MPTTYGRPPTIRSVRINAITDPSVSWLRIVIVADLGQTRQMFEAWTPELELQAREGLCRLSLSGVTYGYGMTLQEAGNDLLTRLFDLAVAFRDGRYRTSGRSTAPNPLVLGFLRELGDIVEEGGDLRARVFGGVPAQRRPID